MGAGMINGCSNNGRFWVFLAGTTNVELSLVATDLETGAERIYANSLGETLSTRLDTEAFSCERNDFREAVQ